MISIVVATDKNGVIGRENRIPWRIRDDLVMLKRLTVGHTVILGRVTYDSMVWYYNRSGRPMPGKMYIVVTRNPDYKAARENAKVVYSIDEAVSAAKAVGDPDIFVVGGGGIFEGMLPFTDRIYFTEVQTEAQGDSYFPKLDMSEWREISREHHKKDDRNEYDFDWIVYERK
ncbi:MAG TPA: dihydrofolate reductase [Candidatus Saccharimonadales bacterium]|nr:dihydrofolate reductase [Candidatus Saccharimonadales bacterium]